jgi:hypothetical protein
MKLQEELNATNMADLINRYRRVVNEVGLNQQDAFWGILLSETQEAVGFLGEAEARRTILRMVDEAFKVSK